MSIIVCHLGWSSLCILCQMLPVSLVCPLLIATSVGLRCVFCAKCWLCLWNVHYWLPPRLVFVVYIVPNVACVFGMSIIDCHLGWSSLWILGHMLPVSLECPLLIATSVGLRCGYWATCCLCLWNVHYWLPPRLVFVVYVVPNVACVFGLSIFDCHLGWSSLCMLCQMLLVSLDCPFLIATSVGLRCVYCVKCCLCLWNVHYWLPPRLVIVVYIVPNVACVFGLSIRVCHLGWSSLCILCQMLLVSLECPLLIATSVGLRYVYCAKCCLCLWNVHYWLPPRLVFVVYIVPNVACVFGMSIIDCHLGWSSLCILCHMLPVSLVCPLLIATSVGLCCVYCAKCCLCLWYVHYWLPPRLVFVVYFVPNVACVFGLSIFDCHLGWSSLCMLCQMLLVSLDCPFLIATSVGLRCVYCAKCCLCLWNVHYWLPPRLVIVVYSVPNVACVFGMSIIDCHLGWSSLCILCQMLPVYLVCPLLIATSVGLRCVFCAKCCLCLWYVHYWLPPRLVIVVYSVPNVACVFGMSVIDCHLGWSSLCILCQMLPVYLVCPLLIATSVGLRCVYCAKCCLCLWYVHYWLPPRLVFVVYIVPNVACVFGMSIIDCHLGWSSLCILCQMLPVSLECPLLIATSVGHRCV